MIKLVEGAERQKTPNEIALDILLAGLTIVFLFATVTLRPFALYSGSDALADRPRRAPRLPHPDDDRRPPLGHRHRGDGPRPPAQRPRDVGPGGRGVGRRERPPPRQDGDDHARQPAGGRVPPGARRRRPRAGRAGPARLARRRDARGALDRRPRQGEVRHPGPRAARPARALRPVHRPDADVGPRLRRGPEGAEGGGRRGRRRSSGPRAGASPRRSAATSPGSPARAGRRSSSPTAGRSPGRSTSRTSSRAA